MRTERTSAGRPRTRARRLAVFAGALALLSTQAPAALASKPGDSDPTFGTGGIVSDQGSGAEVSSAMVIQPDKKIVVVGRALNTDGNYDFLAARYNPNGTPDNAFGGNGNGKATVGFGSTSNEFAFAVAL